MRAMAIGSMILDTMKCSNPHCDHTAHKGSPMYLHQNCHVKQGVDVTETGHGVEITCSVCGMYIATIAVRGEIPEPHDGEPDAPYWVSYYKKTLYFECARCEEKLGTMVVLRG